jgi:hypothetical protein
MESEALLTEVAEPLKDLVERLVGRESGCPWPTGMENIPSWPFHSQPSRSWIMVAKAIYDYVPKRPILLYQETLRQSDPNGHHHEIATFEVFES